MVSGAIITAHPICENVKKENQIKKLQSLLETESEFSKIGTWEYNLESGELFWCKKTKLIHGVSEMYKPNLDTAIEFYKQGHSRNKISMLIHNAIQSGDEFQERLKIITQKGDERWVLSTGKTLFRDGKIIKLLGTFQDISEQINLELKAKESQKLLHTLIDYLPLNVYIKDLESRKILVNKSECEFLGVKNRKELLGKNNFDLYDKKTAQMLRNQDLKIFKNKTPVIAKEEFIQKKDGTKTPLLVSKIPLKNEQQETYALLGISMDISALKNKEKELRHLIDVTSIQNKKLVNFAHIVSHNLRSHSANFSMLLGFLKNERNEEEKKRIVNMLSKSSSNLLNTLDNLNEVVKINSNTNVTRENINLKQFFVNANENLFELFKENKVAFLNKIPENLNLQGIPSYYENIILNLLTNAVKYRHPNRNPKIVVRAKKEQGKIAFSVEDNGLGINLRKYGDQLFGMYKTFHNNEDARGIGLYITKSQIEAMGGTIIACSQLNKGTIFKIYFDERY